MGACIYTWHMVLTLAPVCRGVQPVECPASICMHAPVCSTVSRLLDGCLCAALMWVGPPHVGHIAGDHLTGGLCWKHSLCSDCVWRTASVSSAAPSLASSRSRGCDDIEHFPDHSIGLGTVTVCFACASQACEVSRVSGGWRERRCRP